LQSVNHNLLTISEIFNKTFYTSRSFPYLHFPSLQHEIHTDDKFIRESFVHNRTYILDYVAGTHSCTHWEEESRGLSLPLKVAHPSFGHVISILARCLRFLRARLTYDRGDLAYWRL